MEFNKEDAIKAKEIAEIKLTEKDFTGAKKVVLKAQALFPELEGIPQLLTTLEVYIASENKVNGEMDWYGVLGVNPSADDEAIRKQFRKLALVLHPDKNKSAGADGAFKLVSQAWTFLSDTPKRLAYNQRRFSKGIQHNMLMRNSAAPPPPNANGFHNVSRRARSSAKVAKSTTRVELPSAPCPRPKTNTFWTICRNCKMHYEYLRVYLNNTLLCPNCHEPFHASETSPPVKFSRPPVSSTQQRYQNPKSERGQSSSDYTNVSQARFNIFEKRKREHEAQQSFLKKRSVNDDVSGRIGSNDKPNIGIDFVERDIMRLKMEKARRELRKKLVEWHVEAVTEATEAIENKENQKKKEKEKDSVEGKIFGVYGNGVCSTSSAVVDDKEKEVVERVMMNVPDPDPYNFNQDRTEKSFQENQVWAVYGDDDGMPRFYAMIHKVISLTPFEVEMSWLNSKTNDEFGHVKWVVSGFSKTCGEFKSGKHETNKSLNSFSHKVKWGQGRHGNICIYPKRGDVWALYRNWSRDWNVHTPNKTIHKYDMVEVLEDYSESQGVVYIAPLMKVSGFKTVFRAQTEPDKVRMIPKQEMFRFSHQVPNRMLTGFEYQNVPRGCLELDPAATPVEL